MNRKITHTVRQTMQCCNFSGCDTVKTIRLKHVMQKRASTSEKNLKLAEGAM